MADVEVDSEENVLNSNEAGSTQKTNEAASSKGSEYKGRRAIVSRVKDGWNGVWMRYPVGSIYPSTYPTFTAMQSAVMEIVNANWNEQPPHNPESGLPADTYQIPSEGQEYVFSYLAHPLNGGNMHHVPRLRRLNDSGFSWGLFGSLLAEVHFYAPGSANEFPKLDIEETYFRDSSFI